MFYKKLFVAFSALAVAGAGWQITWLLPIQVAEAQSNTQRTAANAAASVAADSKKSTDKSDVSPEVREKAVALLKTAAREVGNYAAAENRVRGGIMAADLLWEHDEEAARTIFQNVEAELQAMFNDVSVTHATEDEPAANDYTKRYTLSQLRSEFLLALAPRDPQLALQAFHQLRTETAGKDEYDPLKAEGLELEIAAAVAKKDPEKSYELASRALKTTLDYSTINTLGELYKNNPEVGAKFARDILAKFKTAKVRRVNTNSNTTNAAANISETPDTAFYADLSTITTFLQNAQTLNRQAEKKATDQKKIVLLNDSDMRELSDLTVQVFIRQGSPEPYAIGSVMPIVKKYSPAAAQMVRARLNAEQLTALESIGDSTDYYSSRDEKSVDEIIADAEKSQPAERDSRYADAITKALEKDELEKADEIAGKIKDRKSYEYILDQIKQNAPTIKARRGDIAEVRKMLAGIKSADEKAQALTELVITVANKGDKEAAGKLLDEANVLLPAQLKRKPNLDTTLRIAGAFAVVQPERAFNLIETSVAQMNELIQAGVLIQDFYEYETVQADEVLLDAMHRQGFAHTTNITALIKTLAAADFARTVALSDKFGRQEIRLFVRLKIAEALLNPEAAEREKTLRETYQNDEHGHE